MKGKIDEKGVLHIQRGLEFKSMKCRQAGILASVACDDGCPVFGEPQSELKFSDPSDNSKPSTVVLLKICQGIILIFNQFTDERE